MTGADESLPAARERAVEALTRGFADDLLSESELESALDRVYRAGTLDELATLTAALVPAPRAATPALADEPVPPPTRAPAVVSAILSGQERKVTGMMPPNLRVRSRLGYVELDLTDAVFQPGVTEIDVRTLMGYVQLRLPADVRVESEGRAILGYFALRGGRSPTRETDVTVRITGRAVCGYAECLVRSADASRGQLESGDE